MQNWLKMPGVESAMKQLGGVIFDVVENSAENLKREVCRKLENDIFESRKTGKLEYLCGKQKTVF